MQTHCVFQLVGAATGHLRVYVFSSKNTKINISVCSNSYGSMPEALTEPLAAWGKKV